MKYLESLTLVERGSNEWRVVGVQNLNFRCEVPETNREKVALVGRKNWAGVGGLNPVGEGVENPPSPTRVKRPAYHTNDYLLCHHHYDAPLLMKRIQIFFIGPERYIFHGDGTHC